MEEGKPVSPSNDPLDWIPPWVFWMVGSLGVLLLALWGQAAPDWCLLPVLVGAFFAYRRSRETPVIVLWMVLFTIILTSMRISPESIVEGVLSVGQSGDHLGDKNWVMALLLLAGILGISHASQLSVPVGVEIIRADPLQWVIGLIWILVPALALSIFGYFFILGEPNKFLEKNDLNFDLVRARFLGMAFFGGGGLLLYAFIRGLSGTLSSRQGDNEAIHALGELYETQWRQTRREQSRMQQWIVKAMNRKG